MLASIDATHDAARAAADAAFDAEMNAPTLADKIKGVWDHSSTSEKVAMVATGVGIAGSVIPYAGDYVALGGSVVALVANPSWERLGDVGLDGLGAALPFVPAMGTMRRVERMAEGAGQPVSYAARR